MGAILRLCVCCATVFATAFAAARADLTSFGWKPDGDAGASASCAGPLGDKDGVVTIRYDFAKTKAAVGARADLTGDKRYERLTLEANYGVDVRLRVCLTDASGQTFRHSFGILASEWERKDVRIGGEGWAHSGGAADGVVRHPLKSLALYAENALGDGAVGEGRLCVRNVALLEKGAEDGKALFSPPLMGLSFEEASLRATNAYLRLCAAVPRLESQGVGAKSRATLTVLEKFFGWVAEDRNHKLEERALSEMREMAYIAERGAEYAEDVLAGSEKDFPVPQYRTSPVAITHAQAVAERQWPDGHRDRGPVFFNGFGHFELAKRDLEVFPKLGCNLLQIEIGPAWVVTSETGEDYSYLNTVLQILDRAERANVGVDLLVSPHYWPQWTYQKWPQLAECRCYGGFCPYDHNAKEVLERYLKIVVSAIKDKPALHSICLSNEPASGNFGNCPRLGKAWRKWLAKKYGTAEKANEKLGLALASFDEAKVPAITKDGNPSPVLTEFIRFNRTCFAAWHEWLAGVVHKHAPAVPVHSKIQVNPIQWQSHVFYSVDPVAFGRLSQYNGNDSVCFIQDNRDPSWAHNWWWMELGYDLQRSAADKPVFNSENHLHPDRSLGSYIPGEHTYAALWQNALHGQNASALWCWDRAYGDPKSDFNGLVLHRPEGLEGYAHCALDLSRLADRLAPIQNLPPSVLVLYSTEGILRGGAGALTSAYCVANFLGQPVGVVTEEMLSEYAGQGSEVKGQRSEDKALRPFDSAKVILLPIAGRNQLPEGVQGGLKKFEAQGGHVVLTVGVGEAELHARLSRQSKPWGLPDYPTATDPATQLPAWGVETRGVKSGGTSVLSLCNHSSRPRRIRLPARGVDLISGRETPAEIVLDPLAPQLIELR